MVVNVGPQPTAGGEVARLAAWILAGPDYDRDARTRTTSIEPPQIVGCRPRIARSPVSSRMAVIIS